MMSVNTEREKTLGRTHGGTNHQDSHSNDVQTCQNPKHKHIIDPTPSQR